MTLDFRDQKSFPTQKSKHHPQMIVKCYYYLWILFKLYDFKDSAASLQKTQTKLQLRF